MLINFNEKTEEFAFEKEIRELAKKYKASFFIDNREQVKEFTFS